MKKIELSNYTIEKLSKMKEAIIACSSTYMNVFNGEPFYESWDLTSAYKVLESYIESEATILAAKYLEETIGFLVATPNVPKDQRQYTQYLNNTIFIEEIGVLSNFRKNGIASEMIKALLLSDLAAKTRCLEYRTNAMRYFEYNGSESFESAVMRVQEEDRKKRSNQEKIFIPSLSLDEKQQFINQYVELILNRPDLDVSNSNALFMSLFSTLGYSQKDGNYSFQEDPTGEGNDRIFPFVDLEKSPYFVKERR